MGEIGSIYYAYILISKDGMHTYSGSSSNVDRRLLEHNRGKGKYSRKHAPYEILCIERFSSKKESLSREKFYKSTTGRRHIKKLVQNWRAQHNINI